MSLVPCPSCQRHVKSEENACPFCEAAMPTKVAVASRAYGVRAAMLFGAGVAVIGCGPRAQAAMYGGPPPPPASASATSSSTSAVPEAPVAAYGAPAPENLMPEVKDAGTPIDAGSHRMTAPMYGGPPKR